MTIQIIGFSGSTCTQKVFNVLEELGLSYEFIKVKYQDIKTPEYLATNHPFGKVPVLIDDGFKLYESRAIARYLINKYQGTKNSIVLIPSDVQKAALVEQFISVETSYYTGPLHKLFEQVVLSKYFEKTADPVIVKDALEEINKVLDVYEKLLEDKDYLTGEFSLADALHCPYGNYAIKNGYDDLYNNPKRPNVTRWWKNITERECWKKVASTYELF
ncbi:glutathione S-transferase [Glomus cerebriforme]|uniref:glutathione transferase n=1 Tax=Glomus cerebriforme TaxID=658196 RepID=A0A397SBU1_9GLOM|nr:glutathione S-transferase [Glomus cerebriforme]